MNDPAGLIAAPRYELVVEPASNGVRIDTFLTRHLRNYHPWRMQRLAQAGAVTVNHVCVGPTERVFTGQLVSVTLLEPPDKLLSPQADEVSVLYEDHWLLVINKPAGMVVHPTGEDQSRTLANVLQGWLDARTTVKGLLRPGIVHRLDRQTSGAIAIALTHTSHVALSTAFEQSRVSKSYLALVEGRIERPSGVMDWAIGRAPTGRHVLMSCRADALDRRPARTQYRVLARSAAHTLVLATPRTGRNHQIRVHFATLGYPLVGDEFYEQQGRFKPFHRDQLTAAERDELREIETGLPIRRHALHAARLSFAHPVTGAWLEVSAPLPDDFRSTLETLGMKTTLAVTAAET